MTINSSLIRQQSPGQELSCFCDFSVARIGFQATIDRLFHNNTFKVFYKINSDIERQYEVLKRCEKPSCMVNKQNRESKEISLNKFTSIVRLGKSNKVYTFSKEDIDKVFIIKIKHGGLLKLTTKDADNNQYVYILSEKQIVKIRQF